MYLMKRVTQYIQENSPNVIGVHLCDNPHKGVKVDFPTCVMTIFEVEDKVMITHSHHHIEKKELTSDIIEKSEIILGKLGLKHKESKFLATDITLKALQRKPYQNIVVDENVIRIEREDGYDIICSHVDHFRNIYWEDVYFTVFTPLDYEGIIKKVWC